MLGIRPRASVGKWDTEFAVGVGMAKVEVVVEEVTWPGSQMHSKVLSF
tara:strand:+ start:36 stop:179 length:144 start_codon:yes stop_codon:yes gene_type:complete